MTDTPLEQRTETPEAREARILTARVLALSRNYELSSNQNERVKTDNAAKDLIYSFLFREDQQDSYWNVYLRESGREK